VKPFDRERVYCNLMSARNWTMDYISTLSDYQLVMAMRPEEDNAEDMYPDGGGDNDFLILWQNGKAHGKSDEEIVKTWCRLNPGREDEAVIEANWKAEGGA
jgi:hypothetical protein